MRKFLLLLALTAIGQSVYPQDFSNKGKDFWVGYGLHCRMFAAGNTQDMVLYFATDAVTNVTVSIPGLGYTQTYNNIPANTIFTTNPLPKNPATGGVDARLTTEGTLNKGIHITSDKPIVAYAHIYNGNVSGATLLFPTNTLGKEYYSINFDQHSNEGNSNSFFYAIATDTGTTTIEVTPKANTQTMVAGQTYTVNLTQGQVFNVLGTISGTNGVDVTGSIVKSISSGGVGCKRIAVYSGSGKIHISCPIAPGGTSADNYMVQAFPKNAWGKYYLTVPTKEFENNFFRIAVSDPTTVVKINGAVLTGLINNFYYQIGTINTPNVIEADKPIMVVQYITSQGQCGNGDTGDPEVIYLSPVEQNINKVILNSTSNSAINPNKHYINVVIPTSGTSSFRIDGGIPSGAWQVHPQNPSYSYLQMKVAAGQHIIQSDSGFNAIAYGYGPAESYGYNAGSNVRDLYQYVTIQNEYAEVNFPAGCKNSPLRFAMTFPYQPIQLKWVFGSALNAIGINDTTITSPSFDSSWVVNGKTLYRYKLNRISKVTAAGTYSIKVLANNPTSDGCSGEQEINYDLQIFDPPTTTSFQYTHTGCLSDSVVFTDNTDGQGRAVTRWNWNFGDGGTSAIKNPKYKYATAGNFVVRLSTITDVGCISDTAYKTIYVSNPPIADFVVSSPTCEKGTVIFTDQSNANGSTLVKWTWNFGDGNTVINTSNAPAAHTYSTSVNLNASLLLETSTGCKSIVFTKPVSINPKPKASFQLPGNVCLPQGNAQFTDQSTISDGSQGLFTYAWDFGDGGISTQKNPLHRYSATGPFNIKLSVTSKDGCAHDTTMQLNTIYPQPKANFTVSPEACLGAGTNFTDQSNGNGSNVAKWRWEFGDGQTDTVKNPVHIYATAKTYTANLYIYTDKGCISDTMNIATIVNPLPTVNFNYSNPDCETKAINFTDASAANAGNIIKWNWSFGDGNSSVQQNPAHTFAIANTYSVKLDVETNKGCKSTEFSGQVKVNYQPVPDFETPEICLADPFALFTDSSTIGDNSQSQFTYLWDFGDPNANAGNPNSSTLKNPQHKYAATGIYAVKLRITSKDGCVKDTIKQFTVNGAIPQAGFTVNNQAGLCSNADVSIVENSTVDFGNIVKVEIYWDYLNDPTKKTVDDYPRTGKIYKYKYADFGAPLTKTFQIRYVSYSGINCINQTTKTITVNASPQLQFDAMSAVCEETAPFQVVEARETAGLSGSGIFTGTGVNSTGMFNPALAKAGLQTIRYTYTTVAGCTSFADQSILVHPTPFVDAGPDRVVLEGGYITLSIKATGNNLSYLWTPNVAIDNNTISMPKVSPAEDITYLLKVTSGDNCTASDDVFVKVLKQVKVPNAFSPNNDGINDKWEIQYLESYPGCTIEVFNRYGQPVFQSTGYSKPWDGTYKGTPLPVGTYYWIINPKNGRTAINGSVTIIR